MKEISSILAQMTLDEKAALCTGASAWTTTPVDRLGIPEMIVSDGPHGVRRVPNVHELGAKSLPATCFPTASCLAATWDVDLIHKMGQALAEECIALDVDVVLGPGVNMKRSPGRSQLRVFFRGSVPVRRDGGQPDQRHSGKGRGHLAQAFCRE
jgi:beta-glucosidase